jgi:preprotein translocase subunit SecG
MSFLIFIHILICILLGIVILMQSGRGGGLTEQFASAESMFGAKTNSFMVRTTTVLATFFLVSSLFLAISSSKKTRSLMPQEVATKTNVVNSLEKIDDLNKVLETTPEAKVTNQVQ